MIIIIIWILNHGEWRWDKRNVTKQIQQYKIKIPIYNDY